MAFVLCPLAFVVACAGREAPARLTIAVGPAGSASESCGRAIAEAAADPGPTIAITAGALESLRALGRGRAQLALAPADTLAQAVNGEGPFAGDTVSARTLATLYISRLHLVVPADSAIRGFSQLRNHTVGLAEPESGTDLTATRALEAALLDSRVTLRTTRLDEGVATLTAGRLDALFWLDAVPSPSLARALGGRTARLINNSSVVPLLQRRFGTTLYETTEIPAGAYGTSERTGTVGVATVLVARHDLPDEVGFAVARSLLERTSRLVAGCPAARGFDLSFAARSTPAALQAGAARFYRESGAR